MVTDSSCASTGEAEAGSHLSKNVLRTSRGRKLEGSAIRKGRLWKGSVQFTSVPIDLNSGASFLHHFLIRRPFPAHAGHCGGPQRALRQPRPLHLSPLHCPRVTELTRGLRLPAYSARTPPPCDALISGKPSPPSALPAFRKPSWVLEIPASSAAIWLRLP